MKKILSILIALIVLGIVAALALAYAPFKPTPANTPTRMKRLLVLYRTGRRHNHAAVQNGIIPRRQALAA